MQAINIIAWLGYILPMIFNVIQSQWNIHFSVTPFMDIRLLQIFAHAMTAQLSWHMQNFVAIISSEFRWEPNEITIVLWWQKSQVTWAMVWGFLLIVLGLWGHENYMVYR